MTSRLGMGISKIFFYDVMTFSVSFRQIKEPVEITRMYYKDIPLINLVKPRLHFNKDSGMWLGFS